MRREEVAAQVLRWQIDNESHPRLADSEAWLDAFEAFEAANHDPEWVKKCRSAMLALNKDGCKFTDEIIEAIISEAKRVKRSAR